MFSGCYEKYVFEKHGNHCFVCVADSTLSSDEKETEIPGFVYYAFVLRVASLGIENYTGVDFNGCVDGYYCHINLDRKDGTQIHHVTYEYRFPPGDDIDRLYKFLSAVKNKRLIRHMCKEISHTKTYREIRFKVNKGLKDIKDIFTD